MWKRLAVVVWGGLLFSLGCVDTSSIRCDDGRTCPSTSVCDEVNHGCVQPEQLETCVGVADQTDCSIDGLPVGMCRNQVCIKLACGDGIATASEQCDRDDVRGVATCDQLGFHTTATVGCRADCTFDTTLCRDAGACGDGVVQDAFEECDLTDLSGETCDSLGYHGGMLSCLGTCRFNLINCAGECGDGVVNGGEMCDGTDFGGMACTSLGYYTGTPTCSTDCSAIVETSCSGYCGDTARNGPEDCDGSDLDNQTCANFDFYTGSVACNNCGVVTTGCSEYCGDSTVNGGELCDGFDQAGNSCQSFGASGGPLTCGGFCQPTYSRCHWATWRNVAIASISDIIHDMWGSSPTDIWAVGNQDVAHWDGQRWTVTVIDGGQNLRGIWGASPNDVWAVGISGAIYRYNGTTWSRFATGMTTEHLNDVWGSSATNVWIVGDNGLVLHWNGTIWTTHTVGTKTLSGVFTTAANNTWVVGTGETSTGKRSFYDGASWTSTEFPNSASAIHGVSASDIWIVGATGSAYHLEAGNWIQSGPQNGAGFYDVHAVAANDVWFVGDSGLIRHWDGNAFTNETSNTGEGLWSIWPAARGDLWAGGTGDFLVHYDGPGWTDRSLGVSVNLNDLFMLSAADGFAIGTQGADALIYRFDGTSWNFNHTILGTLYGLFANSANDVWAVGGAGLIMHRTAGGWASSSSGTTNRLNDVWGTGGTVWAVGASGTIRKYTTATGWQMETSPTTMNLNGVWGSSSTDIWAVGQDGNTVLHYNGNQWSTMDHFQTGQILLWVWGTGPSDVWAGGAGAVIHYDGTEWKLVTDFPYSLYTYGAWAAHPNDVWITGSGGTAVHYDGSAWSLHTTSMSGDLYDVSGRASDDVWATGPNGTFLQWTKLLPTPAGGTCARPIALYCGSKITGGVVAGDVNRFPSYAGCTGARADAGGEIYYELASPINGDIAITLTPHDADLDLVVLAGTDSGCVTTPCAGRSQTAALAAETVTLADLVPGQKFYAVIDGFAAATASSYTLEVVCTKK